MDSRIREVLEEAKRRAEGVCGYSAIDKINESLALLTAEPDPFSSRRSYINESEWVNRLYEVRGEPDKLLIMITNRRAEILRRVANPETTEICRYTLSNNKAPYPRVVWDCECGFQYAKMEGYTQDAFRNPSNNIDPPSGECMKCHRKIVAEPAPCEDFDEWASNRGWNIEKIHGNYVDEETTILRTGWDAYATQVADKRAEELRAQLEYANATVEEVAAQRNRAMEQVETLREFVAEAVQWSEAYPEHIFTAPTAEQVDAVCKTLGFRIDRIAAMVLREFTGRWSEKARALLTATEPKLWSCKTINNSDPPQDCNWPFCGCDPHAGRVIEALTEMGWTGPS